MAYHFEGKAIFSTRNGKYARREKIPSMRTILRSNPIEDQHTMVAKLQEDFPDVCKTINSPVTDNDVYEHFDYCDAAVHGFEFLRAVLEYIAGLNASVNAEMAMKVQDYVGRWKNTNAEAFKYIRSCQAVTDLFTEEDIEKHGVEFLTEAMVQIKRLKFQEDSDEAHQSALRLQMQHADVTHNQRSFTQLQASARPLFAVDSSSARSMRASSNPEYGQPQSQEGSLRYLPGPPGQFPAPQGHFPLQRCTPSTEVLEYIYPGSTSRGDFHSDSAAHNAIDTYNSGPPNNYVAIPSRGLPGPFNYRPLPPLTQPVPLLNPTGTIHGNIPKGKNNPKKKSSDDARIAPSTGMCPRQPSNGVDPRRTFTPQKTQMPFYSRPPGTIPLVQEAGFSLGAVPYSGNLRHPKLPIGHRSASGQEPSDHPPYHRQARLQSTMEDHSRERAVINPLSSPALELQNLTQDPRSTVPSLPIPINAQNQSSTASEQPFEESAGLVSPQERSHASQPLETHTFEYQLPVGQTVVQHQQDQFPKTQIPALPPVANSSQAQLPGTRGRSRANDTPKGPVQQGCTIWIGALPNEIDKATLMDLLRPCRGLLDVRMPRPSPPSRYHINHIYAFAVFQGSVDAAEALERIPQMRSSEGTFLKANYPRFKAYTPPGQFQHGSEGDSKRPVANVSPTKSRKGEDSNHVSKPKTEHGRKPSKGSARWKQRSTGGSEGKPGQPSERVSMVDADQKESDLKTEDAIVCPYPKGKAGSTAHVSQSSTASTDGPISKPVSQDPGALRPDFGVEPQATQVSKFIGDRVQDISSAHSARVQVEESHQARSPKRTEGRTRVSKNKSKGSSKLPVPESKGPVSSTVRTASGSTKPQARAEPSVNKASEVLRDSSRRGESDSQAALQSEASKTVASKVPLEPNIAMPKDLETADQSFLGCNPTGNDGERPNFSVANIAKASAAKDNKTEVLETAPAPVESILSTVVLEESKEQTSQAMRRDESSSTQGSAGTDPTMLSYTGPPSTSQTERSNSIAHEILLPIVQAASLLSEKTLLPPNVELGQLRNKPEDSISNASASQSGTANISKGGFEEDKQSQEVRPNRENPFQNAEPGETAMELRLEINTSLSSIEMGKGAISVREGPQTPTKDEFGSFQPALPESNLKQTPSILTIQPSTSKSDGAYLRSPARNRALSIPPRSSSLAALSTPIKTHQKKKPRNLTPVKDVSPLKATGLSAEGTKMDCSLQTTGRMKLNSPVLTINTAVRTVETDKSRDLPKPETPFLMDDGMRVTPPKINRQSVEALNADGYYAQKKNYQVFHWGNASQINSISRSLDSSDLASTNPSETSTPDRTSAKKETDLETTLREAGFRGLSGTSSFTIRDPELAWLENIDEEGRSLENRTNKDGPLVTWLDDRGKIASVLSFDAWNRQNEMIEVVKKATAVKRLLAGSPPTPWAETESLRQQLLRFVTHFPSNKHDQQITKPKAHLKAEALLDTVPRRDSSISEMHKWSRTTSRFMEENASKPLPACKESRKSTTTSSPRKSSRGTALRRQQQERRHPVLINLPDTTQTLTRKFGRDEVAVQTANAELDCSSASAQTTASERSSITFGRRTPSDEEPSASVVTPLAALGQDTKLKGLLVEMEDRRRRSEDRHRFRTAQEERIKLPNPELNPSGEALDACRLTVIKDVEPEQMIKEKENEVQQKPFVENPHVSKGIDIVNEEGKQAQESMVKSDKFKDSMLKEKISPNFGGSKHQKPTAQLLDLSFSSFDSNRTTTSNETSPDEAQHIRPRGGHSPLKRSGYNAAAGRGMNRRRSEEKDAGKDPWALPQGEKPWGSGCEGRSRRKRRGGQ